MTAHSNNTPETEENRQDESNPRSPKAGFLSGVGKVTGVTYASRNIAHVKRRMTFPLLRTIIKNEALAQRTIISVENIDTEYLQRTAFWQRYLALFFAALGFWALLSVTRGLAAGIRFDLWLNNWLLMGVPLLVLTATRTYISYKVYRTCRRELIDRQRAAQAGKNTAKGGA